MRATEHKKVRKLTVKGEKCGKANPKLSVLWIIAERSKKREKKKRKFVCERKKKTVSVRRTQVIHFFSLSFAPLNSRTFSSSRTHTYLLLSLFTRAFICMQTELIAKNRTELIFLISFTYMSRPMLNAII